MQRRDRGGHSQSGSTEKDYHVGEKRTFDGMASYSYKICEATCLTHVLPASENEYGVHCSLVQDSKPSSTPAMANPKPPSHRGYTTSNGGSGSSSNLQKSNSIAAVNAAVKSITTGASACLPSMPNLCSVTLSPVTGNGGGSSSKKDRKGSPSPHQSSLGVTKRYLNEFVVHASQVKKLFEDRPATTLAGKKDKRDIAYLKVCQPGKAFESYDREKYRLAMTVNAYFEVLKFFKNEYRRVENRMEDDYKNMIEERENLAFTPRVGFYGGADIEYRQPVDMTNTFQLDLVITKEFRSGKRSAKLAYSDESMGSILIPANAMEEMAEDLPFLVGLANGDYKENMIHKRARQY